MVVRGIAWRIVSLMEPFIISFIICVICYLLKKEGDRCYQYVERKDFQGYAK